LKRWNNLRPHPRFRALMEQMQFTAGDGTESCSPRSMPRRPSWQSMEAILSEPGPSLARFPLGLPAYG